MTFNLLFFTITIQSNKTTLEEARNHERQMELREQQVAKFLKYRQNL